MSIIQLKRKRSGCKRSLTEFQKFLDTLRAQEAPIEPEKLVQLEIRLDNIQNLLRDFQEIQYEIDELSETENDEEISNFEKLFYATISSAKQLLKPRLASSVSNQQTDISRQIVNVGELANNLGNLQLPKIPLPKFSGKYTDWLDFRDIFDTMINKSDSILPIQKLYYLKASLEGEAKKVVEPITTSSSNFDLAWETLCKRYENKRLLIHNHIRVLFDIPVIKSESASIFRGILDTITNNLHALKMLKEPVDSWDSMLVYSISNKFDQKTSREWEAQIESTEFPKLEELKRFLQKRAEMLEALELSKAVASQPKGIPFKTKTLMTINRQCYLCNGNHTIYNCDEFLKLSPETRNKRARSKGLCLNCLRPGHFSNECSSGTCRVCKSKHNTLLHDQDLHNTSNNSAINSNKPNNSNSTVQCKFMSDCAVNGILSTAQVNVHGRFKSTTRLILDTGSQSNFITKSLANKIRANIKPANIAISGLNNCAMSTLGRCEVEVSSRMGNFTTRVQCYVVEQIAMHVPILNVPQSWTEWNVELADPNYDKSGTIDLLLGNGLFWSLITDGNFKLESTNLIMQNTVFGWIFAGPIINAGLLNKVQCSFSRTDAVQLQLARFWEIEEGLETVIQSDEELFCENHFATNHKRNNEGRFIVSIPFKASINLLGDSCEGATKRFCNLERRLQSNPALQQQYSQFMREYETLNHMTEIPIDNFDDGEVHYYIPHHAVLNEFSKTTKLRVVFDASHQTTTGYSLNSIQCVGPTIQQDLISILLRFRQHLIAVSADITKMYRQVLVGPTERNLQRILWRDHPSKPINTFKLNTVTYGTAAASFLAIRCLQQLAIENTSQYPKAADTIRDDFYVDDLLTGADDVETVSSLCKEINNILLQGCFPLRKWLSNKSEVLHEVSNDTDTNNILLVGKNENTKTLGLYWAPNEDVLSFNVNSSVTNLITKRSILSAISQIFDPLGLLGPCIVAVKIILQEIWLEKLDWDDPVSDIIQDKWIKIRDNLHLLNGIKIHRHAILANSIWIELHGFADASQVAYGGCAYIRSRDTLGNTNITLLYSKSKVAPLKVLTMPRLELCAALVLAKLVRKILNSWTKSFNKTYLWCDSQIVLAWLKTPANTLKIFVANRVVQINDLIPNIQWLYVPSKSNPADLLSRGMKPYEIPNASLWWSGPEWLVDDEESWPVQANTSLKEVPEMRVQVLATEVNYEPLEASNSVVDFSRFSSVNRLYRVIALCLRFEFNLKNPQDKRRYGMLIPSELSDAKLAICKIVQREGYPQELKDIQSIGFVRSTSSIAKLSPFLDDQGIMRVGGRLKFSNLSYHEQHPIILPPKHHFVSLLLLDAHLKLGHAGASQMLCLLREQFWPVRARNTAKTIIHKCVRCFRAKPRNNYPTMGMLPRERVTPAYPFEVSGVDYAGPFTIKFNKGRGTKTVKCYIALFVCFTTKAVHMETVSDLSSTAFLAALRRFIARRGCPRAIYSDNATNFVGASRELGKLLTNLHNQFDNITSELAEDGISWHFIPPKSPHFGGLWEAAIKSAKFHLKRILSSKLLTFEEFNTFVCQVEAILNCRPLTPISDDPKDLEPLTPSHFLIGRRLTAVPDATRYTETNGQSNFKLIQGLLQRFWDRWSHEYLQTLNPRSKWVKAGSKIKVGDLVLLQEEFQPPMNWPLARVIEIFPGSDGQIRVATVKTSKGQYKRAVSKLYPLPINLDLNIMPPEEDPNINPGQ